jgi:hypothetical protein
MDPDPGGPKTCGSCGSGSPTLKITTLGENINTNLLLLNHVGLPEDLHGVDVAGIHLLYEPHLPEGALPDHLERLEVVDAQTRALQAQKLSLFGGVLAALF